jgi:hypothetical protein
MNQKYDDQNTDRTTNKLEDDLSTEKTQQNTSKLDDEQSPE